MGLAGHSHESHVRKRNMLHRISKKDQKDLKTVTKTALLLPSSFGIIQ